MIRPRSLIWILVRIGCVDRNLLLLYRLMFIYSATKKDMLMYKFFSIHFMLLRIVCHLALRVTNVLTCWQLPLSIWTYALSLVIMLTFWSEFTVIYCTNFNHKLLSNNRDHWKLRSHWERKYTRVSKYGIFQWHVYVYYCLLLHYEIANHAFNKLSSIITPSSIL